MDMTAKAKHGMKKQRTLMQGHSNAVHHMQVNCIPQALAHRSAVNAFYANFLAHFTVGDEGSDIQNELTWFQRLPGITTDRSNEALVLALEATATAYGAIMSSHRALEKHARCLYGTALRIHHELLKDSVSGKSITIHMVSTSVLLSFFEAMQATTADGYCIHIYGAAKLFEVTGPGQCARGVLCQLFYHVRTQMLFVQLATDHRNIPISARRILQDTLQYQHPPLIQRLMSCIAELGELEPLTRRAEVARLEYQVSQLWDEYGKIHQLHQCDPRLKTMQFSDPFMALTMAFFSSAYILLAVRGPDGLNHIDLGHYFELILDAATYLDTDRNAIAFMRMSTPLLLIALYGQHQPFSTRAVARYEAWSARSMRGISALALDAIRRREQKTVNCRYREAAAQG